MFCHATCNVAHPRWECYLRLQLRPIRVTYHQGWTTYMLHDRTFNNWFVISLSYEYYIYNYVTYTGPFIMEFISFLSERVVQVCNRTVTWAAVCHAKLLHGHVVQFSPIRGENILFVWKVVQVCNNIIVTRAVVCHAKLLHGTCGTVGNNPIVRQPNSPTAEYWIVPLIYPIIRQPNSLTLTPKL